MPSFTLFDWLLLALWLLLATGITDLECALPAPQEVASALPTTVDRAVLRP